MMLHTMNDVVIGIMTCLGYVSLQKHNPQTLWTHYAVVAFLIKRISSARLAMNIPIFNRTFI